MHVTEGDVMASKITMAVVALSALAAVGGTRLSIDMLNTESTAKLTDIVR